MKQIGNPSRHGVQSAIAGMAHFQSTGPANTYCTDCVFVDSKSRKRTKADGLTGRCVKFASLMRAFGPAFPLATPSCKYFESSGQRKIRTEDYR